MVSHPFQLSAGEERGSLFAGLHFLPASGGAQALVAPKSGAAQLWDTATASVLAESEPLGALSACELFEQHGLLLSASRPK